MKIAALLLTAVVVLNSVDKSLQSTSSSSRRISSYHSESSRSSESSSSSESSPSPGRREPSLYEPRFPYLPHGSLIIRDFQFPKNIHYKVDHDSYVRLVLRHDVVLNYERKVVAVFLESWENEIYGLYYGTGTGSRIKLTPACIGPGQAHVDHLDAAGYHYYPEFHNFEKPDEIIIESMEAYRRLGRGLSCAHTDESRSWYSDLPAQAHIVRGVEFPQGFFFKIDQVNPFHPLMFHSCDVVVDPSGMIVAVFLGPSEYRLLGIYREAGGKRVKLHHVSMEAEYSEFSPEESRLYIEFMLYKKPQGMIRDSFAERG